MMEMTKAKKILVIEEDGEHSERIDRHLRNYGHKDICLARSGSEGLEKTGSEDFDLVLIVTSLSDIDGYEVCRRIKETRGDKLKVILMTGLEERSNLSKAMEVGADDYIVKTSDCFFLMESVKMFSSLGNRKAG